MSMLTILSLAAAAFGIFEFAYKKGKKDGREELELEIKKEEKRKKLSKK